MRARDAALGVLVLFAGCRSMTGTGREDVQGTVGSIERLDPAFDALVPQDAQIEVLSDGYLWTEGPVWVPDAAAVGGGYVLFSDIPPNKVYKWESGKGVSVFLERSGYLDDIPRRGHTPPDEPGSNALLLDSEGRLVLCQHGLRQMARMNAPMDAPRSEFAPIATHFDGKRFNSPNDAVFHRNGDLFFTDPPYGLPRKMRDETKELDFQGVFRVRPDGTVHLVTKELSRPNGIAFAPDHRTLYVGNSDGRRPVWMAFPVADDGSVGAGQVFFDASGIERRGAPDGFKVDRHGNLFASGPGGILVLSPEGKHLGTLLTGQATSNCAFGNDGRTLYITADRYLLRVRLTTTGAGF